MKLLLMDNVYIISQVLGYIALALICFAYCLKNKTKLLVVGFISNIFYAVSFLLLNSVVAFITTIFLSIKLIMLYFLQNKNYDYKKYTISIFIALFVIIAIIFVRTPIDVIPIITVSIFSVGYELKNLQLMRIIFIIPNIMLFIYSLLYLNYAGALLAVIELSVLVVALIKNHISNKKRT